MTEIWREKDKNGSTKEQDCEYDSPLQRSMVEEEEEGTMNLVPSVYPIQADAMRSCVSREYFIKVWKGFHFSSTQLRWLKRREKGEQQFVSFPPQLSSDLIESDLEEESLAGQLIDAINHPPE